MKNLLRAIIKYFRKAQYFIFFIKTNKKQIINTSNCERALWSPVF